MVSNGTGWVRTQFRIPSRSLIGIRAEFLSTNKSPGIANALAAGYEPGTGEIVSRLNISLIADRAGVATQLDMIALQERGSFFVSPNSEVYAEMIVGENSKSEDIEVNITKEKQLTDKRAASADNFVGLAPQRSCPSKNVLSLQEKTNVFRSPRRSTGFAG
jgi:GTP-binding protein